MACRKLSRRHATRLMMGAACATTFALTACAASGQARGIDWNAVGRAIGQPLKTEAQDVHTAEWLRTDLHVVNAGVRENPGMELNAEASFHPGTFRASVGSQPRCDPQTAHAASDSPKVTPTHPCAS